MSDLNDNLNNGENFQTDAPVSTVEPDTAEPAMNEQPAFAGADLVSGVEPAKKKPVFLIVAIIAVILAAGSVSAYFFIPYVKNSVKMLMNKPEEYYLWVEEQNMKATADCISEAYGNALRAAGNQNEQEIELKADIDPENVGALIEELTGSPLSDSGITLPSSVSVKSAAKTGKGKTSGSVQINADDNSLATMNMYMEDGKYYYQVPELSPAYISMDLESLMNETLSAGNLEDISDEIGKEFIQKYMETLTTLTSDPGALEDIISEKELNDLIVNYSNIIFENIEDVELEKGVSCNVNGQKIKYNKLSANIDQGTLYSIAKDALKAAKKDKTIINIVEKFGLDKSTYTEAIDNVLDQLGTVEISGGETMFIMNVYVNSSGKICGRDIEIPDEEDMVISFMTAEKGSDSFIDFEITEYEEGIKITGKSTEKSGKESGNVTVNVNMDGQDIEVPVTFKNCKVVNEDKGYCEGSFNIDLEEYLGSSIKFDLSSDGKGQTIKTDVTVNDTDYGSITLSTKEKTTIDIPDFDSSQKVYNFTTDGAEVKQYLSDVSETLPTFLDNISSAFGVKGLGQLFGAAISGSLTDDSDDYYDDYDYDNDIDYEETKYDLSKVKIEVSGQTIPLPAKISGILDLVKVSDTKLEANGFASYYSDDYGFGVNVSNDTNSELAPADCTVTGIHTSEGSAVPVSIDGFSVGSNISDIALKYGAALSDPSDGYLTIYDSRNDWNSMTFYYYNGKVNSMSVTYYEY